MVKKKTRTSSDNKLKVFHFHGVDINNHKTQARGTCPFCDKDEHFYVKTTTGQWSCKVCGEGMPDKANGIPGGNIPTFLARLLEYSKESTTAKGYRELSEDRVGCPVWALKEWGVVKNFLTGDWLIPAYNNKGKLSNVFKVTKVNGKWVALSSPGCKLHPMGVDLLLANKRKTSVVRVQEGPWDAIAVYAALGTVKKNGSRLVKLARHNKKTSLLASTAVLCVPGSGVFQDEWFEYLEGKEVRLGFDNDHPKTNPKSKRTTKPGWDGMTRIVGMAEETRNRPSKLLRVRWTTAAKVPKSHMGFTKKLADGYDYRDLVNEHGAVKALKRMEVMESPAKLSAPKEDEGTEEQPDLEPIPRSSFRTLCQDFKDFGLYWHKPLEDTFAVMLACMMSTDLKSEQIWLRVIGPPSSGKTTLAEACSASREYAFPVSLQTGFHSGHVGSNKGKRKDSSLIPQMAGKTTIIKDGDTLLTSPARDRILAELRDLYDRTSRARYRNRQTKVYEGVDTTFILCGTDDLRALNRSSLGERFLDVEIIGDADTDPYKEHAIKNAYTDVIRSMGAKVASKKDDTYLKQVTMGFLQYLKEGLTEGKFPPPTMSVEADETIKALGELLAFVRARVKREGIDMTMKPRKEMAPRLIKQFTKLAVCVAVVLGKKSIDREVIRIIRKVALDTGESFNLDIIHMLARMKTGGVSHQQMSQALRISEGSVRNILKDMVEFKIVKRDSVNNRSGQRGRNRHLWKLEDEFKTIYQKALGTKPKKKVK